MKIIKLIMLFVTIFAFTTLSAQEETKKVVIVKKMIDKDGKTTTEKTEASGAEADALIKKMKEDGSLEGIDVDVEIEKIQKSESKSHSENENIWVEKKVVDGKEITRYKIETESDGEKKVMIWEGDGEMPAEMAEKMGGVKHKMHKMEDGQIMFFELDEDEEEIHEDGDMEEHEVEMHDGEKTKKRIRVKKANPNKVSLGIMIADDSAGVLIDKVIEGSAAEKAGLKAGDIVLKINADYVFNTDVLLEKLSVFKKGDKAEVTYMRDGKEKKTKASF